jgi:hypothetical protein
MARHAGHRQFHARMDAIEDILSMAEFSAAQLGAMKFGEPFCFVNE